MRYLFCSALGLLALVLALLPESAANAPKRPPARPGPKDHVIRGNVAKAKQLPDGQHAHPTHPRSNHEVKHAIKGGKVAGFQVKDGNGNAVAVHRRKFEGGLKKAGAPQRKSPRVGLSLPQLNADEALVASLVTLQAPGGDGWCVPPPPPGCWWVCWCYYDCSCTCWVWFFWPSNCCC